MLTTGDTCTVIRVISTFPHETQQQLPSVHLWHPATLLQCYIATVSTFDTTLTFAFPPFRHLLKPFRPTHATFRLDPPGAGASVHNLVVNFARPMLLFAEGYHADAECTPGSPGRLGSSNSTSVTFVDRRLCMLASISNFTRSYGPQNRLTYDWTHAIQILSDWMFNNLPMLVVWLIISEKSGTAKKNGLRWE